MLNLATTYEAVNWNRDQRALTQVFWDQQWKQIWFPEEIAVSKDLKQWSGFEHQDTYKKVLGGLTLLDTIQTNIGMNEIARYATDLQEKALYSVFASFEAIHAKSYSYIFTTLCKNNEISLKKAILFHCGKPCSPRSCWNPSCFTPGSSTHYI